MCIRGIKIWGKYKEVKKGGGHKDPKIRINKSYVRKKIEDSNYGGKLHAIRKRKIV